MNTETITWNEGIPPTAFLIEAAMQDIRPKESILEERDFVQAAQDAIKAQIDGAKRLAASGGPRVDLVWLTNAEAACRRKGRHVQKLNREVTAVNQAIKHQNVSKANSKQQAFERAFIRHAKAVLPDTTYSLLLRAAIADTREEA